jgi:hypothetical protein
MIEIGGGLWWDIDTDVRTLYYRRDMLQDAGIDPAELDAENGPITVAHNGDCRQLASWFASLCKLVIMSARRLWLRVSPSAFWFCF